MIAVGVVAGPPAASSLRTRFGAGADAVYYPYPLPFSVKTTSADSKMLPQMFLMTFKVAPLRAAQ